jgi:hypothetical protein
VTLDAGFVPFRIQRRMFDAHPNERAHAVIAQEVMAALERLR